MGKLFYSYRDGEVYILHKRCPLELLMEEQAGGDGLLMYFTARVKPKTSEPLSGIMFDMDRDVNEFFEYVSTVTGKKC